MKKYLIAAVIFAAGFATTAPAFASGYGPDSNYNPVTGAPASQRGPSSLTLREENIAAGAHAGKVVNTQSYGGVAESTSNWGNRTVLAESGRALYVHH